MTNSNARYRRCKTDVGNCLAEAEWYAEYEGATEVRRQLSSLNTLHILALRKSEQD